VTTIARSIALTVLVAVLAGCGGATTTTRTVTVVQTRTTTLSAAGVVAPAVAGTPSQKLTSYLNGQVMIERTWARSALDSVDDMKQIIAALRGTTTWQKAADRLQSGENEFHRLAATMRGVVVPAPLIAVHRGLAQSADMYASLLDDIRRPVAVADIPGFEAALRAYAPAGLDRIARLGAVWRVAAQADATRLGVAMPPVLRLIGGATAATRTPSVAPAPKPRPRLNKPPAPRVLRFSGNGQSTLPQFGTNGATLSWTCDGPLFIVYDHYPSGRVVLSSQGASGSTVIDAGRYELMVSAVGNWTMTIKG
jgi:hypothetical protein